MKCENVKQMLPLCLNNELDRQQSLAFKKHLNTCSGCRSELTDLQEVDNLFKTYLKPETAPDFQSNRIKSKKRYYYLSTVAAAILVFYIIFSTVQPDEKNLTWDNNRIIELIEMNDNLDLFYSDYTQSISTFNDSPSAEYNAFYSISEDVDYLLKLEN